MPPPWEDDDVIDQPGEVIGSRGAYAAGYPADDPPGACRSSRRPSGVRKIGPSQRSPMARSITRAVRGANGMVTTLPPLRVMTRVRCPRSTPKASISAPLASKTRSPLRAGREGWRGGGGRADHRCVRRQPRADKRRVRRGRGRRGGASRASRPGPVAVASLTRLITEPPESPPGPAGIRSRGSASR